MFAPGWVRAWLKQVRLRAGFEVRPIDLSASRDWGLADGMVRHRSGRFFTIVGVRWEHPCGRIVARPFIEQRDIGILGFMIRRIDVQPEILVQAKVEPGNVGAVQLAPTCQATASNAARVHGGDAPPFLTFFEGSGQGVLHESLQSEQGSRFLRKRNRNLLVCSSETTADGPVHRWLSVDVLLKLLTVNFLVNTDARSVLISSPWEILVNRIPFEGQRDAFARDLAYSHAQEPSEMEAVKHDLRTLRERVQEPEIAALVDLEGWRITHSGVSPDSGLPFAVRQIHVHAKGREVSEWDQPMVDSASEGRIDLICGRREGVLRFLFRPSVEAGLYNKVELGPSIQTEPGEGSDERHKHNVKGEVKAKCWQSEEGGRFFRDTNFYRLIDIGRASTDTAQGYWLSLSEIRSLLDEGEWFTNEARSALSLLLSWA